MSRRAGSFPVSRLVAGMSRPAVASVDRSRSQRRLSRPTGPERRHARDVLRRAGRL